MLDKAAYIQAFHADTTALADAADLGVDKPLPCCPGWTVSTLLGHLGGIYLSIARNISVGQGEDVVNELADLELDPPYERWFREDLAAAATPSSVVDWFRQTAAELESVFRAANPDDPAWTWWPADQTAGFWMRRMAHETAVHRWDAQLAHHRQRPIEPELARDGIDEVLGTYQQLIGRPQSELPGRGESYHFHRTDGEGEWLVRFEGRDMLVSHEHAKADVAIRGAASDLLLFLWHRIPADRLEVLGDTSLVDRYFELVLPD